MLFSEVAIFFERLEKTSSRLEMTATLVELFKKTEATEIGIIVNLSLGQLQSKFDRLEFNLAEKMVMRAIGETVGIDVSEVKKEYKSLGDIGATIEKLRVDHENSKLSVKEVFEKLRVIAEDVGQGSQERKTFGLAKLLGEIDGLSAKFIARMVVGKLRLGFSDMTILDALSWMEVGDKSKRKDLEQAYQYRPDVARLAELIKEKGIDQAVKSVKVELGVPVVPALAQRLKTADEMIKKMGKVAVEPKFDGTRVQIHFRRKAVSGWHIKTFTRNLDETTEMFPELVEMGDYLNVDEVILDSEGIAYDSKTGALRPFQDTIQRKRKHGIAEAAQEIPLKFFVFDVLYVDGEVLVDKPFHERRKILEEIIKNGQTKNGNELIVLPEIIETDKADEVREFHARQLSEGLEGALVKKWDGVYEPGRRGWSWVKFKEAETSQAKLADTVDAVVMGLYVGKGKRTAFGVGAFLIGIRGERDLKKSTFLGENTFEEGKFYTVSKVGTGLSDDQWKELKARSKQLEAGEKPKEYEVHKDLSPDIWLSPGLVVEVAADEVTKSPNHTVGLALRFPRLVKFRDDKDPEQTTSVDELVKLI